MFSDRLAPGAGSAIVPGQQRRPYRCPDRQSRTVEVSVINPKALGLAEKVP